MNDKLIIDVRRSLPWRRRAASDLATAAIWALWAMLCLSSFAGHAHAASQTIASAKTLHAGVHLPLPMPNGIGWPIAGLALATLWIVPRLQKPAAPKSLAGTPNYAGHFGLTMSDLDAARATQVCVVHHDASGRIVAVKASDAPPAAPNLT